VVFKRADHLLVVSNPLRLSTIKTYGLEESKVSVFPNGVNINKFRSNVDFSSLERNLQIGRKKVILFIGSIRKERGLVLMAKALPRIVAETQGIMLLLVGGGPQKSHLAELMKQLGVGMFVKFVNAVDNEEIPKYICMADIPIGPLVENIDTFGSVPRKVLEYMACAKPLIAHRGGVSHDLIKHGYNGFLVDSQNPQELASLIQKLIHSPSLVKETGLNAREYVKKFFDWDQLMPEFERTLRSASMCRR